MFTAGPAFFANQRTSLTLALSGVGAAGAVGSVARGATDPFFANVVLLCDSTGYANGTTPSTIDVVGKSPTWGGDTKIDTSASPFGGGASIYFDGTGDSLSFADSIDWAAGTGDYTWEFFVNHDAISGVQMYASQVPAPNALYSVQIYRYLGNLTCFVSDGSGALGSTGGGVVSNSVWHHIAIVREATELRAYLDGTRAVLASLPSGYPIQDASGPMCFGMEYPNTGSFPLPAHMDQIRFTKGVARYTGPTITVPTAPFPHS
jgi:hypothetical protein